jgi:two-component system sensor histidine kinase EvgS
LAIFRSLQIDLILMDYDLPDGDVQSLARAFRELEHEQQRPYCPIVAMSRLATDDELLERCFDAGIDGLLNKPINRTKLQQMIELWCEVLLAPPGHPLSGQKKEGEGEYAELRKNLSNLIEAVALCDHSRALQALPRLRDSALAVGWTDITTTVEMIEQLLSDEVNWPAAAIADHLNILFKQ